MIPFLLLLHGWDFIVADIPGSPIRSDIILKIPTIEQRIKPPGCVVHNTLKSETFARVLFSLY